MVTWTFTIEENVCKQNGDLNKHIASNKQCVKEIWQPQLKSIVN
jgi:hypothetical protein